MYSEKKNFINIDFFSSFSLALLITCVLFYFRADNGEKKEDDAVKILVHSRLHHASASHLNHLLGVIKSLSSRDFRTFNAHDLQIYLRPDKKKVIWFFFLFCSVHSSHQIEFKSQKRCFVMKMGKWIFNSASHCVQQVMESGAEGGRHEINWKIH